MCRSQARRMEFVHKVGENLKLYMKKTLLLAIAIAITGFANASEFAFVAAEKSYNNEGRVEVTESMADAVNRASNKEASPLQTRSTGCSTGCSVGCSTRCNY